MGMLKELGSGNAKADYARLDRRSFIGGTAAVAAGLAMSGTLAAGVRAARADDMPVKGGVLKAGMSGGASTDSLDPATFASEVPKAFGRQWGEQLVQISPKGELIPALAEEWGSSPDARVWTFKIRKGVEFHNGATLNPDDVVATMERHAGENSKSGAFGIMRGIETVKRDGDTVVFTLKEANADLPYLLEDYHLMIQPGGGKDNPAAGIGTGPYKVVANEPGVRHGGEKFANYWRGDERGHAAQIEVVVINDTTARVSALQSGQVDMINRVEPKIVDLVRKSAGVVVHNVAGRGQYVFVAHCDTGPFDNNDLRLALKYAIDRKEMVDKILRGYGSIGNDFPINTAYPLFSDDIEQREFDPDKAKFHYKKSGHDGTVLLRTSDVAFSGAVDAAQLFQQSCAKAGIKMEVKREPGDGYWTEVWNKQPFCASYWSGRAPQAQMYSTAYLSSADWNDTRFKRPDFDKMVMAARGELDQAKRKQAYRDIALMVRDDGGVILPMFNNFIDASGSRIRGWVEDGTQEMGGGYALSRCWVAA